MSGVDSLKITVQTCADVPCCQCDAPQGQCCRHCQHWRDKRDSDC